ncbi:AraC family transcriptional regulator [Nocardia yamanashiensis]|uniref:AraC family transcriptional regulator n=1 Tax=Nocardia yamanashiensis TaxID=209247 RepID=UPI0008327C39|nr:AraC family transcriptional regulator [Nocardia yamanashiensis]
MIGTFPSRTADIVRKTALRVGVSPVDLAGIPGLYPAALGDDLLRVPTESVWRMWELIDAIAGPGSGLCATAQADRGGLRVWDYLFSSGGTLAEGVRTAAEFRAVVTDPAAGWEVIEDGRLLTIRATRFEPEKVLAPIEEYAMSSLLRRMREATRRNLVPVRVAFGNNAGNRHRCLVDEFGTGQIDFGAPRSELTFLDAGALPTGTDPKLGEILKNYTKLVLAQSGPVPSWHETFRAAIAQALYEDNLTLTAVADRLAINTRTLQRRLAERNSNWRAEVEAVRHEQAKQLLRDTDLPVQSVAARLGYSDARVLRRAFGRWTGQTPDAFRREFARHPARDLNDLSAAESGPEPTRLM